MADRKLTVLNPNGYQEILQNADRLILDGQSRFDGSAEFTSSAIFSSATFSGNITINGTPSANTDAATVAFTNSAIASAALNATLPLSISGQTISIASSTDSVVGAVRLATNAEASSGANVSAAVTPNQLTSALNGLSFTGAAPIVFTETTTNNYDISISAASNSAVGAIRLSTDAEVTTGTLESVAVNPKQLKDKFDAVPSATNTIAGLIRIATSSEASTGTLNTVAITPLQVQNELSNIDVTATSPLNVSQNNLEFDLSIDTGTATNAGILRLANSTEFTAGTATNVAITPAQLQTKFNSVVINDATTSVKGIMRLAFNSEVAAGVVTDEAVTPASMRYALDQPDYVLDGGSY